MCCSSWSAASLHRKRKSACTAHAKCGPVYKGYRPLQPRIGEKMQDTSCVTRCFKPYCQGNLQIMKCPTWHTFVAASSHHTDSCLGRLERVHGRPSLPNPESVIRVLLAAAGREVCAGLALAQHLAAQATEVVATRPAPAVKFPGVAFTQYEHWRWHHSAAAIRWHALQTTAS